MSMEFEREYGDLLRRVNRIERWMERWGDSDRRMRDLYPRNIELGTGVLFGTHIDGRGTPIQIKDNLVPDTIESVGELGNRFDLIAGVVADFSETVEANEGFRVTAVQGLGANYARSLNLASQEFPVGFNIMATETPATGYRSIIPVKWTVPAKVGNLDPVLVFGFTDLSTVGRFISGGASESHAVDVSFQKEDLTIIRVEFAINNVGGSPETGDIGLFSVEGWQV